MSDGQSTDSGRSSSQASQNSADSKNNKTIRIAGPRRHESRTTTKATHTRDPSLTSFPSFSPHPNDSEHAQEGGNVKQLIRTTSQMRRDRKDTLAGLTSASPAISGQAALFQDSPRSSFDVPGSLHLANDDHIQRLIAKTGASKLLRQYARDLAQRDAEISTIRIRADNREKELKNMLREADVATADIEARLMRLENRASSPTGGDIRNAKQRQPVTIDGMMDEAMSNELRVRPNVGNSNGGSSTILDTNSESTTFAIDETVATRTGRASTASSQRTSRTSSLLSQGSQDVDATLRAKGSGPNAKRLSGLQSLFQPAQPASYFIGGQQALKKPKVGDQASIRSGQSAKSFSSWTRIFGGAAQPNRSRASSLEPGSAAPRIDSQSALASLQKVRTASNVPAVKSPQPPTPTRSRPANTRTSTATRLSTSPRHGRKDSNASSQPPTVEMDAMIESTELPPTMASPRLERDGFLTDRFGFIYEQRQRKRAQLQLPTHKRNKLSASETIGNLRSSNTSPPATTKDERPSTPVSVDGEAPRKSWQDYLKVPSGLQTGRPKELLSHTPSASAVVTVNAADVAGTITPPRNREPSVFASSVMPVASTVSEPQSSDVAPIPEFTTDIHAQAVTETTPTKLLLEQLTDLHDSLQAEREARWNDFLRRVRAERASTSDRSTNNAPEAEMLDGELIGIASLGRSVKAKSKYLHFKSLVLAGIPVSLRPKVWAECSGASAFRVPDYYEDLVRRSQDNVDVDQEIASQIKVDVRRTLTDNIFFRHGPGVQRLEELLRAYSLHNPTIGYCQGMNLITASLLLICESSQDCFWLLVAIIDHILPSGYFETLIVARADQVVLRQYVSEVLPKLDAKLEELGVELEASTFHWFLSLFSGVLTGGEALYRVWDVILCLNSSDAPSIFNQDQADAPADTTSTDAGHDGTSSPFLFQLSLALLKLNENAILAVDSAAACYSYINSSMTNHAITVDQLVQAGEALRTKVKRADVLERRKKAVEMLTS